MHLCFRKPSLSIMRSELTAEALATVMCAVMRPTFRPKLCPLLAAAEDSRLVSAPRQTSHSVATVVRATLQRRFHGFCVPTRMIFPFLGMTKPPCPKYLDKEVSYCFDPGPPVSMEPSLDEGNAWLVQGFLYTPRCLRQRGFSFGNGNTTVLTGVNALPRTSPPSGDRSG